MADMMKAIRKVRERAGAEMVEVEVPSKVVFGFGPITITVEAITTGSIT